MRNLRTMALTLGLLASAGLSAYATTGNNLPAEGCATLSTFTHKAYVAVNRPGKLNLIIEKQEAEPVKVRIRDFDGHILLRTQIKAESAMLPVDISQLEPGTYTVEFVRCNQTEVETFMVR